MSSNRTRSNGQPDLREFVWEAVNRMATQPDVLDELRLSSLLTPDRIEIRCQRMWHDISSINPYINDGSLSACVAQFHDGDNLYSFFIEAIRPSGDGSWHCAGMSGGQRPPEMRDRAGGFMIAGGSHVCVGGMGYAPEGGRLQIELADGSIYSDTPRDNCCIVFAPVTTSPSPDDHVTVRFIGSDGAELHADRVWIGDSGPPPTVRPTPST